MSLMPRVFSEMSDWFDIDVGRMMAHPIRVEDYQDKGNYVIRAELPGMDPDKDIRVTVDQGVLTLEAERSEETHDKHHTEFRYGTLLRSVRLPSSAVQDKITARYDKGILEIRVPLKERAGAGRPIAVERGQG